MLTTQLISASDLHSRYVRLAERGLFPDLMRRLIVASDPSVRWIHFRAHEGIAIGGWDGRIEQADGAGPYVPAKASRWELGTNDDALSKIKSDFEKRNATPEADADQLTLVFAVIRRRKDKEEWAKELTVKSAYKEVHIIDADDLETWLQQHPGIHIWLSVMLGKYVEGAQDLENWWLDWANQTAPIMQTDWLLAGRTAAQARLTQWLTEVTVDAKPYSVFASTADEARAFIAACILTLPDEQREVWLARTIVATSELIWEQLLRTEEKLLLIPQFDSDCLSQLCAAATRRGHRVLLPRPSTEAKATDEVVPPLGREALREALQNAGIPKFDAGEKASLARRSFTAFHRTLLTDKSLQRLWWQDPAIAASLLPLALLGRWVDDSEGDQEVVASLTGKPYAEVQHQLAEWAAKPNPPVRSIANEWFIIDPSDMWEQTAKFLSSELYQKFGEAIQQVLAQPLARFSLPPEERMFAGLRSVHDTYSPTLREGLVTTLALISSSLGVESGNQPALVAWVNQQLRQLLDKAFAEPSGTLLASLNYHLPLLAEAAPDIFLASLLRELKRPESVLSAVFQEERGLLHSVSHHTGLLWALEGLAWVPQYLSDAAAVLAGLVSIDPGGQLSNRPVNSLRNIFLGWNPQTNASVVARLTVIDRIRRDEPEVSWRLLLRLLPQHGDVSWPTHTPAFHWRDWQIKPSQGVDYADYFEFVDGIAQRLLADAGTDAARWAQVISELPELLNKLEPDLSQRILEQIGSLGSLDIPAEQRADLLDKVREFLNHHRSHPDANWAWSEEQLIPMQQLYEQLQPTNLIERSAWYFDQWPKLPQGIVFRRSNDSMQVVQKAQADALAELLTAYRLDFLPELLRLVPQPYMVGDTIGRSMQINQAEKTSLLQRYLDSADERENRFALGLASSYAWQLGPEAAADFIRQQFNTWHPSQVATWLQVMRPSPATWQLAEEAGAAVKDQYWLVAPEYVENEGDSATAARQLLEHRRPLAAAHILSHLRHSSYPIPNELVLETLEFIAAHGHGADEGKRMHGYELSDLLDELNNTPAEHRSRAVTMAFIFSRQASHKIPAVIDQALREDPKFFVEVLGYLYKPDTADDESSVETDGQMPEAEAEEANSNHILFAHLAFHIFYEWKSVPGVQSDGTFDGEKLKQWVANARAAAAEQKLMSKFAIEVGKILSHAPAGPDGTWPHAAVCEILEEERGNQKLRESFHTGCYNRHGRTHAVTGGVREQGIADDYTAWASQYQIQYPAAASLLRELADTFNRMAAEERQRAAREDQFGMS